MALQALSKYAKEVYSNTTDLTVQFGEENSQFSHTFRITENNRLVSQTAQVNFSVSVITVKGKKYSGIVLCTRYMPMMLGNSDVYFSPAGPFRYSANEGYAREG